MSRILTKASTRQLMDKFFGKSVEIEPGGGEKSVPSEKCYAVIRNIPGFLRSKELRIYFSDFTENGLFACFHYKHRPELKATTDGSEPKKSPTCCCVVSFATPSTRSRFIKEYHGKHWTNAEGMDIPPRCFVSAMKVVPDSEASGSESMTTADVSSLVELKPPTVMPQGNVGTPSEYFMEQIKLCRLPSSVISKLGIKTGRRRRKFGAVPFAYNQEEYEEEADDYDEEVEDNVVEKETEKDPLMDPTDEWLAKNSVPDNDEGADDDRDQCEEWERHEALHDDVTEQERTKPKKYEEEMEVVWEKGGPGLVWHMDKNYWDEREKGTDMDWKWADDWDVDYSVYYEGKSAGTLDGRQAVEMREDDLRRAGKLVDTVFRRRKEEPGRRKRRFSDSEAEKNFSSDYSSKLMMRMGWNPGSGLGRASQGRVEPVAVQLHEDANMGHEKIGFGYRGEKMQRTGFEKKAVYHSIGSKFDVETDSHRSEHKRVEEDEATSEILLRSGKDTKMKYR